MNRPLSTLITTVGLLAAAGAEAEQFRVQGGGSLKWFGLKIYDAKLLTPQPLRSFSRPLRLNSLTLAPLPATKSPNAASKRFDVWG
jgi:hypothetical protein